MNRHVLLGAGAIREKTTRQQEQDVGSSQNSETSERRPSFYGDSSKVDALPALKRASFEDRLGCILSEGPRDLLDVLFRELDDTLAALGQLSAACRLFFCYGVRQHRVAKLISTTPWQYRLHMLLCRLNKPGTLTNNRRPGSSCISPWLQHRPFGTVSFLV